MARISILSFLFVLLISLTTSVSAQKHKVIFDCNLGDDVDDAFALAMLVSSPDIEVLSLVLDYGNTEMRSTMASRFLYRISRVDIPVVIGRKMHDRYSAPFNRGKGFEKKKPIEQGTAEGPAPKFDAPGADITCAGLDVTSVKFREELRRRIFDRNTPLTDFLSACYALGSSQTGNETPTLYDPVAIGMSIDKVEFLDRQMDLYLTQNFNRFD